MFCVEKRGKGYNTIPELFARSTKVKVHKKEQHTDEKYLEGDTHKSHLILLILLAVYSYNQKEDIGL